MVKHQNSYFIFFVSNLESTLKFTINFKIISLHVFPLLNHNQKEKEMQNIR
jgi:hypothetical protein